MRGARTWVTDLTHFLDEATFPRVFRELLHDRWAIRRQLTDLGYPVLVAAGGPAVSLIEQGHASLQFVVTDLFVPGRHGLTLFESIAGYWAVIPILLMLDHAADLGTWQALGGRITAAIRKPVTMPTLERGIAAARQAQQGLR